MATNKKETISFEIKKTMQYRAGSAIIQAIGEMTTDSLPVPVLVKRNDMTGKFEFFKDEIKKENGIGYLFSKQPETVEVFHELADGKVTGKVILTGCVASKNIIRGDLAFERVVKQEVKVDTSVFDSLKEKIVKEGLCSKEELEEKIQTMKNNGCNDELIRVVLERYRKTDAHVSRPKTLYIDPKVKGRKTSIFAQAILNAVIGNAMIFEGDKSVGKNVCAETVAWVLNEPYYMITFNRGMTADDIYGSKSTDNSASNMLTPSMAEEYVKATRGEDDFDLSEAACYEYLRAKAASVSIVQERSCLVDWLRNGGVMTFNEMNMAEANFFASFTNQITDGSGFLDVPGIGRVDIHPNCILIGTQNAEYTGVCEQNDATISRFGCIEFPYPDSIKDQIMAVVGKETLDISYFKETDRYYKSLLAGVHKGQIEKSCLNIRGFCRALSAAALIPGLTTLAEQIEIHVINTCPIDDRNVLLAMLAENVTL